MRSRKYVLEVLLSCALMVGYTVRAHAEDQAAESAPVSPTSPPTAPATSAIETTPATTPAPDEAEEKRRESAEFKRAAKGYRKTEKDGQTLYCRKEKTLGTRIAKPVCLTDAQLRARIDSAEDARAEMSKSRAVCQPPRC